MSYETDQLKQAINNVLTQSENDKTNMMYRLNTCENRAAAAEARLAEIEEFIKKAKPYIDTFLLIDTPEEPGATPCP